MVNSPQDFFNIRDYVSGDTISKFFIVLEIVLTIAVVSLLIYRFWWYPRRFKDRVIVWDLTGAGLREKITKGYWEVNNRDGTGYYTLWNDKRCKLKQLDQSQALVTDKGKLSYKVVKYGNSGFDYAQVSQDFKLIDEGLKENYKIIPSSDLDWAKMMIKREMEKKNLGNFWAENKGAIIFGGLIGFSLLTILWIIGFANDTLQLTISNAQTLNAGQKEIALALKDTASALRGGSTSAEITNPPPI